MHGSPVAQGVRYEVEVLPAQIFAERFQLPPQRGSGCSENVPVVGWLGSDKRAKQLDSQIIIDDHDAWRLLALVASDS